MALVISIDFKSSNVKLRKITISAYAKHLIKFLTNFIKNVNLNREYHLSNGNKAKVYDIMVS